MALTDKQQVIDTLRRADRPVIVFRKEWNPDAVASSVGLFRMLKDMGKQPEIVCDGFSPSPNLGFLPDLGEIRPEMSSLRKFVISVDTSKSKIGEMSYEARDGRLEIYLTPKSGNFEARDVRTGATDYHHDLIVAVDTPDVASLGRIVDEAAEFFHQTPIVNLDHSPANEHYGHVNYVDAAATSVGEIVYRFSKELGRPLDENLATAFLTGMISKTRSFKTGSLTPQALTAASELIAAGAKHDLVVSSLYRTKTIPMLKLWGRVLARMKSDPTLKIVSSVLTRQDFVLAGAEEADLADIIDELIATSPEAETIVLLFEKADGEVCCLIRNDVRRNADRLSAPWNGEGGKIQSRCFLRGKSIVEAEREVLAGVRTELGERN